MNHRSHAFLTLASHAVNEAVRRGLFDPASPNGDPRKRRSSVLFSTSLNDLIPMRVFIADWQSDEARVIVAAWPSLSVDDWIEVSRANGRAGEVVASGWLERHSHLLLVNSLDPTLFVQGARVAALKALPEPKEIADPLGLYPRRLR